MVAIRPRLVKQRPRRGDDLLQQIGIGPEEIKQRRKFVADPVPHHGQSILVAQKASDHFRKLVEKPLVAALIGECRKQFRSQRRHFDLLNLLDHPLGDEPAKAGLFDSRQSLRHQARDKPRQVPGALRVRKPVGDQRGKVHLLQLLADWLLRQEIDLDEAAKIVRDPALVLRDDRGMRNGQTERTPEERHNRVPVSKAADGGSLGEGRDERQPWPAMLEGLGCGEDGDTERQRAGRQYLCASQRRELFRFGRTKVTGPVLDCRSRISRHVVFVPDAAKAAHAQGFELPSTRLTL